LGKMEIKKLGN